MAPGQFIAIVAFTQLSESLQHANLRLGFGAHRRAALDQPALSPRCTTASASGTKRAGRGTLGGHNFGVLLPWWDMLFRTVNFEERYDPTGIRDQVEPDASGRVRDYGRGFWAQQWLGPQAPGRQRLNLARPRALALSSAPMRLLLDSFWRSVAYCLHPRVIVLSLLPLGLMVVLAAVLGYFYWDATVAWTREALDAWPLLSSFWGWIGRLFSGDVTAVLAPLVVVFAATPLIVVVSLLIVAGLHGAGADARWWPSGAFPTLEQKKGASFLGSVAALAGPDACWRCWRWWSRCRCG